ncbi:MAG TPA: hypothetical protein DCY57_01860 [Bacteroidetes bacterium]|nr:hypothetical protein [Bacteroidota bacterium]
MTLYTLSIPCKKFHAWPSDPLQQLSTVNHSSCGGADKVAKVETRVSFVNGLFHVITYGIYTPPLKRRFIALGKPTQFRSYFRSRHKDKTTIGRLRRIISD